MLKLFAKAPPPGPRPRARRDAFECTATVRAGEAYHSARIRDVSASGCKIALDHPLAPGAQIQIALEAYHSLGAVVRWYREGLAGIQFNVPLSDSILLTWKDAVSRERAAPTALAPRRGRNFLGEKLYTPPPLEE